jgi:RNA polymerase-binding transcription factor DksA
MNVETQEHLTTLRSLLVYRVQELETELHALALRRKQSPAGEVSDRKDEADELQRAQVDAEGGRVERAWLQRCRAALERLRRGVYGDCCDCEEPVPLARLLVQLEAERCAACETVFEHRRHAERHPPARTM